MKTYEDLVAENAALREDLDNARTILKYVAGRRDGLKILCEMVCAELEKVSWHIAGAVARCAADKASNDG